MRVPPSAVPSLRFHLELYDLKSWLHFTADMRGELMFLFMLFCLVSVICLFWGCCFFFSNSLIIMSLTLLVFDNDS